MENYVENFKIEFQPKLTLKEKSLFRYLLDVKKGRGSSKITTPLDKLCEQMKIERLEVDTYIKKMLKKQCFLYQGKESLYSNVFEYIKIQEEVVYFAFIKKIFAELDESKNFLGIDLTPFFYFNEKFTGSFYVDVLNKMRNEKIYFYYELEDFKNLLQVGDSYGRFYDFERFVLKKLIKDINENTILALNYERVQKSEKKGSKVVGIRIFVEGKNPQKSREFIDEVFNIIGERVKEKDKIKTIIKQLKGKKNQEEIIEVITFTLKHSKDETVEKDILNSLLRLESNDKLIHLEEFKYKNIFIIQSLIMRRLKTICPEHVLYDSFFSHGLLRELYNFKTKKNIYFKIGNIEINMKLNEGKKVRIEFSGKKLKGRNILKNL